MAEGAGQGAAEGGAAAVDWRLKYEKSEEVRKKLRQHLQMLKEQMVNATALINSNNELKAKLQAEQAAARAAQATAASVQREKKLLKKEVLELRQQLTELEVHTAMQDDAVQTAKDVEVSRLERHVVELQSQLDAFRSAMGPLVQLATRAPVGQRHAEDTGGVGGDGSTLQYPEAAAAAAAHASNVVAGSGGPPSHGAAQDQTRPAHAAGNARTSRQGATPGDATRARAVAARTSAAAAAVGRTKRQLPPAPAAKDTFQMAQRALAATAQPVTKHARTHQHPKQHPAARHAAAQAPAGRAVQFAQESPQASPAAASDGKGAKGATLVTASPALVGASLELADRSGRTGQGQLTLASLDVVDELQRLTCADKASLRAGGGVEAAAEGLSSIVLQHRLPASAVIAALKSAVADCASPVPAHTHLWGKAAPQNSLESWFRSEGEPTGTAASQLPPFSRAWCRLDALSQGRLQRLIHCAEAVDARLQAAAAVEGPAQAGHSLLSQLCDSLHHVAVAGCAQATSAVDAPSDLCAAAAVAAALYRRGGQAAAFRVLLVELVLAKPGSEEVCLPPVAAAAEVWPDALTGGPARDPTATALMGLLRQACSKAEGEVEPALLQGDPVQFGRRWQVHRAAAFLAELGRERWGWSAKPKQVRGGSEQAAARWRQHLLQLLEQGSAHGQLDDMTE